MSFMKTSSVLSLLALLTFVAPSLSAAADPSLSGQVVFVDGDVFANGRAIDTGDSLTGLNTIKTGDASTVEILFGGRNVFRLGPNSVIRIDFSELKKTVNLDKGEFTSVLKKLAQTTGDPAFVLRTPTVNAGVRGTSFHVMVNDNSTYFCTCNGSVMLDDGKPAEEVQLTNAHHGARVFTKQPDGSVTVATAGLEGHTDADLETLANRVGYNLDWTKADLNH
jgi:hypothetical protein